MVKGRLKCIGSPQHLKAKYGDGYTLEIKSHHDRAEEAHAFVLEQFPTSTVMERFGGHCLYRVEIHDGQLASVRSCIWGIWEQHDMHGGERETYLACLVSSHFLSA
jgi:ATP-binding cassette subfamily A (ABC1) protein 3